MIPKTEDDWLLLPTDFPTWKNLLEELLTAAIAARESLANGDQQPQRTVRRQLNSFAEFSPNLEIAELEELDNLALSTATALFRESQDTALQQLAENGVKLSQIAKRARNTTSELQDRARTIRLDFVGDAAKKLTDTLTELENLTAQAAAFDPTGEVEKSSKRVTAALRKLRESVEGLRDAKDNSD